VTGAHTGTGVAVEVLVKKNQVAPMGVLLTFAFGLSIPIWVTGHNLIRGPIAPVILQLELW
jgi:hypothetical protein